MQRRPFLSLALMSALAFTLTVGALSAAPAWADRNRDRLRDVAPQGFAPQSTADRRISQDEAAQRARRHQPGRVLGVKERGDIYEVKLLTAGNEVVIVTVDARSGDIVR